MIRWIAIGFSFSSTCDFRFHRIVERKSSGSTSRRKIGEKNWAGRCSARTAAGAVEGLHFEGRPTPHRQIVGHRSHCEAATSARSIEIRSPGTRFVLQVRRHDESRQPEETSHVPRDPLAGDALSFADGSVSRQLSAGTKHQVGARGRDVDPARIVAPARHDPLGHLHAPLADPHRSRLLDRDPCGRAVDVPSARTAANRPVFAGAHRPSDTGPLSRDPLAPRARGRRESARLFAMAAVRGDGGLRDPGGAAHLRALPPLDAADVSRLLPDSVDVRRPVAADAAGRSRQRSWSPDSGGRSRSAR